MRNRNTRLCVTMPDGQIIECLQAADTLEEVMCKIGLEKVLNVDYENMLIARTPNGLAKSVRAYKIRCVNGYYTCGGEYNNSDKKRLLERIANRLGMSTLKVNIIYK